MKEAMVPSGTAREVSFTKLVLIVMIVRLYSLNVLMLLNIYLYFLKIQSDFGREVPLFEVEATAVEPVFERLYSYIFDMEDGGFSASEMDRPVPNAIFIVNFDKV